MGSSSFASPGETAKWAAEDVAQLKGLEIFDSNIFTQYEKDITRGEFIYIAVRMYEILSGTLIEVDDSISFTDTKDIYALKGATVGITSGIGNDKFGYSDPLNREQLATFMIRILEMLNVEMVAQSKEIFADDGSISDWAKASIYTAKNNNIISGIGSNRVDPKGKASVQVALVISNRILKEKDGKTAKVDGKNITIDINKIQATASTIKGKLEIESQHKRNVNGYTMNEVSYKDVKNINPSDQNGMLVSFDNGDHVVATTEGDIISEKYDNLIKKHKYIESTKDGLVGALDMNGNELVPPHYKSIYLSGNFSATDSMGNIHYYLADGTEYTGLMDQFDVDSFQYLTETLVTSVKVIDDKTNKYGIIDVRGFEVLSPIYSSIRRSHGSNYAEIQHFDGRRSVIDMKTLAVHHFEEEIKGVRFIKDDLYHLYYYQRSDDGNPQIQAIVNTKGEVKYKAEEYQRIDTDLRDGFFRVYKPDPKDLENYDKQVTVYLNIYNFKEYKDYAIKADGSLQVTTLEGNLETLAGGPVLGPEVVAYSDSDGGQTIIKVGDKFGLINKYNHYIAQPVYDAISKVSFGRIKVKKDGKFGFIDEEEKTIVSLIYDDAYAFTDGIAAVKNGTKWQYVDVDGKAITALEFDEARMFNNGFAQVRKGKKWAYINTSGKTISGFIYEENRPFNDEILLATAKKNGQWGLVDYNGNAYIDFKYDRIDQKLQADTFIIDHYVGYYDDRQVKIYIDYNELEFSTLGAQGFRTLMSNTINKKGSLRFPRNPTNPYFEAEYHFSPNEYSGYGLTRVKKNFEDEDKEEYAYYNLDGEVVLPFSMYSEIEFDGNDFVTKYYDNNNNSLYEVIKWPDYFKDQSDDKWLLSKRGAMASTVDVSDVIDGYESVELTRELGHELITWTNNHFRREGVLSYKEDIDTIDEMFDSARLNVNEYGVVQNATYLDPNSFYAKIYVRHDEAHPFVEIDDWCTNEMQKSSPQYTVSLNMARQIFKYYSNSNEDAELLYDFVMTGFMTKAHMEYGVEMLFGGTTVIINDPGEWGIDVVFVEHSIRK